MSNEDVDVSAAIRVDTYPGEDGSRIDQARAAIADLRADADAMDNLAATFEAADGPTKQQLLSTRFDDLVRAIATTNRRLATVIEAVVRAQTS